MVLPEEVAARVLAETVRSRTSLRDTATRFFSRHPELDYMKPVVRVLTLGVARNYILLDRVLTSLGYGPASHSTRWMLARTLAYEAISGKLKPSRARRLAPRAGLDPEKILELRGADPGEFVRGLSGVERLSVLYSFPRWMIEELMEAEIPELPKLLAALNRDPVRWIRVKPGVDMERLRERLGRQGVVIEPDRDLPDVARIVSGDSMAARTEEYQKGLYVIQDKASALVSWVASPSGKVAVDPTAGAAVKASHMAWLGARYVVAGDVKPSRLVEAKRTRARLSIGHLVDLVAGDARSPYLRRFDTAIVDPPCTDIGRLQYEPEVKLWLGRGDLHYFRRLQLRIVSAVAEAAPPRSTIVYSVCTLTRSETIWVVRRLLERHQELELVEPEPVLGERPRRLPRSQRLLPHLHGTQGFFIAKLVKL
ncbi:16S rRNA methyltransferase [Pyrodictium occultum]|uniref:16S rRNA methyltransferase n=2 Tax=Pyrodictium occultum TaxID=2309 RepID=A0A0V8RTG6_PYROC|nr:16S rRNA methyltransferase [Pyrodictium occultum]